jgi:two-component system, sensor histidine kinase PdtaS
VGSWANEQERPLLATVWATGDRGEAEVDVEGLAERTRMQALPVRREGRWSSVLTREWSPRVGRQSGELERHYLAIFERFARMIAAGSFPYPKEIGGSTAVPRVGDGVMVVDEQARVQYASPNAVSALHRVGITPTPHGLRLAELGFDDGAVRTSFELRPR